MKIYLVGGAVRDQLLGLDVKERDWVVVGATPEAMIQQGFRAVGKEFPVFLHPKTQEEYALARTERKVSKGYQGFTFYTAPSVSLEEDLARRDLTINAMAQDDHGVLIDPYHGQDDLKNKLFRHVSAAFAEDPVRILRLARFACRFTDFTIHPDTLVLMQSMVAKGEVDALVSERVWQECYRALGYTQPQRFFEVLFACGALEKLFAMLQIKGNGIALLQKVPKNFTVVQRFAVLSHDLTLKELRTLHGQYRLPKECYELAQLIIQYGNAFKSLNVNDAEALLGFIEKTDAIRREKRFIAFISVADFCYGGQNKPIIKRCLTAIKTVDTRSLASAGLTGKAFGEKLHQLRLQAIQDTIT